MTVQLYPVQDEAVYDASWFSWRPVWNYIVRGQPAHKAAGNSNDYLFIPIEVIKEGIKGATGKKVLEWARREMPDYHLFSPEDYESSLKELRSICESGVRGVVCG